MPSDTFDHFRCRRPGCGDFRMIRSRYCRACAERERRGRQQHRRPALGPYVSPPRTPGGGTR